MPTKLLLCLLLIGFSLPAVARGDLAMSATEGNCAAAQDADADADATRSTEKRVVPPPGKAKPTTRRGGSDAEAATRAPRWHSFLPGMFR